MLGWYHLRLQFEFLASTHKYVCNMYVPFIYSVLFYTQNFFSYLNMYCFLEMSSSWNFPARASPSCEGSEPSRAEALQFPSWNRAEFFLSPIKNYNQISPFSYSIMIITNSNQLHYHLYEFMEDKMCFRKLKSIILLHKF